MNAANTIYRSHLFGDFEKYKPNASVNREQSIYRNHCRVLGEMAINRFKWTGFPETVNTRFLEVTIYHTALSVIYFEEDFNALLAVRGTPGGYVNMNDDPVNFTVTGPALLGSTIQDGLGDSVGLGIKPAIRAYDPGPHFKLEPDDLKKLAVPIWANAFRYPDLDTIMIYAQRLAWLDRTLEINTRNSRRTKVLKAPQNMQLSAVNAARSFDQGDDIIQITGAMQDMQFVETLDLGVDPESYDKLSLYRTRVWNEVVGLFGINHANQDKKERLVSAEVGANDEQIATLRNSALNARRDAADRINHVFGRQLGFKVEVDFHTEIEAKEQMEQAQSEKVSPNENPDGKDKE